MKKAEEIQKKVKNGGASVEAKDGEIEIRTRGKLRGRVAKDGTLEWHSDASFEGTVQGLGNRIELWQDVVRTGDNLISLNEGLTDRAKEPPYSGVKVNRGSGKKSAYLIWDKQEQAWVSGVGEKKRIAVHGDPLSKFELDITTDDVPEGSKKYFTTDRLASSLEGGSGIEINGSENSVKISQTRSYSNEEAVKVSNTHNFWVSNKVVRTRNTDREILPAFISSSNRESKRAHRIRGRLSAGTAEIIFLKNGEPVADPVTVGLENFSQKLDEPLEDGDLIGIGVKKARGARNLSVSISIQTKFNI